MQTQLAKAREDLNAVSLKAETDAQASSTRITELQKTVDASRQELNTVSLKAQADAKASSAQMADLQKTVEASRNELNTVSLKAQADAKASSLQIAELQKSVELSRQEVNTISLKAQADAKESSVQIADLQKAVEISRQELDIVIKREQSVQMKALADIEILQQTLKSSRGELDILRKQSDENVLLWNKERDELRKTVNDLQLERQGSDELVAASIDALRQVVPAVGDVEAKPVPVMNVLLKALLDERAKNAQTEKIDDRIGKLIEENRIQQELLDSLTLDARTFEAQAKTATLKLNETVEKAVAQAKADGELSKATLSEKLEKLEADNGSLMQQMASAKKVAFVAPERVANLLDDFYGKLRTNLKGLDVRDSEVRLKVGFASLGTESDSQSGFVIPTAGNTAEIKDSLGELVLRLGRNDIIQK
ncbi:MAG: hypothetical protein FDX21_10625 [Chlorobium sp.]|nr:MAG: hypothetical protein FDX21_10625 [Chlorobium sp.]